MTSRIVKPPGVIRPNLVDYHDARASFSWDAVRHELRTSPETGLNIAHVALDRHVASGAGLHVALRWRAKDGHQRTYTYRDLAKLTSRFANALRQLDVPAEATVFSLAGRTPELYVAALGTLLLLGSLALLLLALLASSRSLR